MEASPPPAASAADGDPLAAIAAPRPGPFWARAAEGMLGPRWLFLRALGVVYLSAFWSLFRQIRGLIGPTGILPAGEYLADLTRAFPGLERFWVAPSLLWLGAGDGALLALAIGGMVAALLLVANVWPRLSAALCWLLFLSAITVLQDFASYQSDSMLLEAGLLALFLAPRGVWPGMAADQPPSWASVFMLRWEWFRIYFESGVVKLASGDPQWRHLTAMRHYYENGPLPTWIGWYAQQLPPAFHTFVALWTLFAELGLVWLAWLPRPFRLIAFGVASGLQVAIIATANYAFLNYLVLVLGFLLLDDRALARVRAWRPWLAAAPAAPVAAWRRVGALALFAWLLYAGVAGFVPLGLPAWPARLLAPFRVADRYGLFAVMTTARYELELQGTRDGVHWVAYPFRDKPQDPREAPGIYAPYQPRFEWNLWFASLAPWEANPWVVRAELRLLDADPQVLALFRRDPFDGARPVAVRVVRWQYWFTDRATRRRTGAWWNRRELGLFAPAVDRAAGGDARLQAAPPS